MSESSSHPFRTVLDTAPEIAGRLTKPATTDDEAEAVEMMVESVRSWAGRTLDSAAIDEAADVAPEVYRSAAELGLFGLTIPEEHGGAGFSLSAAARVTEEDHGAEHHEVLDEAGPPFVANQPQIWVSGRHLPLSQQVVCQHHVVPPPGCEG